MEHLDIFIWTYLRLKRLISFDEGKWLKVRNYPFESFKWDVSSQSHVFANHGGRSMFSQFNISVLYWVFWLCNESPGDNRTQNLWGRRPIITARTPNVVYLLISSEISKTHLTFFISCIPALPRTFQ